MRRRLALTRFAAALRRSLPAASALALVAVLALRHFAGWRAGEWLVALGLLGLWVLFLALRAVLGLPRTAAALRLIDGKGGWKDCFSSAWEFLHRDEEDAAERLHLEVAAARIDEARRQVPGDLPLASLRRSWIAPLVVILFAFTPWGRLPITALEMDLTEEMRAAAMRQGEALKREADRVRELESLSQGEREELEALRSEVQSVADALAEPEGLTAGEVLESIEEKAGAAERLAEKLGAYSEAWVSAEMLAEMGRHPDTADLALFVGDRNAEGAARESDSLEGTLEDDALSEDTRDRLTRSLEAIQGAATAEDATRPVGERFGNAARKMLDLQVKPAAREFGALARHFRELASREEAQKKLEDLARNLREAGAEIGGSELKKMEEIAQQTSPGSETPKGLQSISALPPGETKGLPLPSLTPGVKSPEEAGALAAVPQGETPKEGSNQAPGAGSAPGKGEGAQPNPGGEQNFAAPVPGEKAPEGQSGMGIGMGDQSREGEGGKGMLSAPVPGTDPGQSGAGAAMNLAAGSSSQSGQGGDQAGTGTAAMEDSNSGVLKAASDAEVLTQAGQEGESTLRAVEGGARAEEASRSRQEVVAEFLQVEEQALDDQSLPLSRRQHVLRYFSAIREQFETEGED